VAHSLSAKKRIRQNIKARARNRYRKELIKDQVKSFTAALNGGDMKKAADELGKTASRLDKVAAKGTIHKNTASRKRSRLARRLNAMVAAGGKVVHTAKGHTGKGSRAAKTQ
jgi:small subunit ribosomal protein S20